MENNTIQASKNKYLKEKVDAFKIYFPKGQKTQVQEFAKSQGKSLNAYIIELINADLEKNNFDNPEVNK